MALLTALPHSEATRLLAGYGLSLGALEPLSLGSVNSNFRVRTDDGRVFFARIYEEQGLTGAQAEVGLLDGLLGLGLPVAAALAQDDGERVAVFQGKPFTVFPWIEGTISCQSLVSPVRAFEIGCALGRLHLATSSLPRLSESRFGVPELSQRLDSVTVLGGPSWEPVVAPIRAKIAHYQALRDVTLPRGIIHGDLFRDNVLWNGDRIAVLLDFESASSGVFMYDLLVTLLAWCYGSQLDLGLARALVGGYETVRPITPNERRGALAEGALACLRFATTRITDFSLRARPGEAPGRDFRRFLSRLAELEAGALDVVLRPEPNSTGDNP